MLAQYLMALLGPAGRGNDPLMNLFGGMFGPSGMPPGGGEPGRWGDYVFNQEGEFCLVADISSVMFKFEDGGYVKFFRSKSTTLGSKSTFVVDQCTVQQR